MGFFADFRDFAQRGPVIELAVGVMIGASVGKMVSSLVENVLMPPIGLLLGPLDLSDYKLVLREAQGDQEAVSIAYGMFVSHFIDFMIVAFALFFIVRQITRFKRPDGEEQAEKTCRFCKSAIHPKATRCPHCTSKLQKA